MKATRILRRARVLIVGCGDVGMRCVELLRPRAHIFALTSQPARRAELRAAGVTPLVGDLDARRSLKRLAGLAPTVLHLAPPQKTGDDDRRTRALLAALTSRPVQSLRPLQPQQSLRPTHAAMAPTARWRGRLRSQPAWQSAPKLPQHPAKLRATRMDRKTSRIVPDGTGRLSGSRAPLRIVYASTTGVYGDCGGALIDETRALRPANLRAKRRASAEQQLRRATARGRVAATIARIPGIYAANRLPLARLEKGTPALIDTEDVYTSHIHADDLAAILVRMATHGRPSRVIHASDDTGLKMGEYFDVVADAYGLPRAPRITRAEAEQQLEPVLLSFMRESRRLSNRRMKRELGIQLRYPTVADFLREKTRGA